MSLVLDPPTKPKPITPEELLAMADGDRYELVNGQLKALSVGMKSSWVAGEIAFRLRRHLESYPGGRVFPEGTGYRCFPQADRVRKPEASFIQAWRQSPQLLEQGYCSIPPDLAVEVLSPNDVHVEVTAKIEDYFAAGVPLVWLVDPEFRVVTVFRGGWTASQRLNEQDAINGDPVLPEFSCQVSEFLPPRSSTEAVEAV
jgi:Uma2 family endonuclease